MSFRDSENFLAQRGITVSYEAIWHLDEVYLKIDDRLVYLWRAVRAEGEVLDVLVQSRRNKQAALNVMRKLLPKYGFLPEVFVNDDLRFYGVAARNLGIEGAIAPVGGETIGRRILIMPSGRLKHFQPATSPYNILVQLQ